MDAMLPGRADVFSAENVCAALTVCENAQQQFGSGDPQPRAYLVQATKIGHTLTHPLSSVRVVQKMCVRYNLASIADFQNCLSFKS